MRPKIYRTKRYPLEETSICRFCHLNPSIGDTDYGALGCRFCQAEVDKAIKERFDIVYV